MADTMAPLMRSRAGQCGEPPQAHSKTERTGWRNAVQVSDQSEVIAFLAPAMAENGEVEEITQTAAAVA